MDGHITVYGEIIPWQDADVEQWGAVNLKGVMNEIKNQPNAEELVVHIHSPGGSVLEAFAIHDALRATGKPITTIIEGLCASSATIICLAGDTRKMMENSEFMIHLPFASMFGDSDDMQKAADALKDAENQVAEFYAKKAGGEAEDMMELMKEETWMDSALALSKGFITEVVSTVKAVATINLKNNIMSGITEKELDSKFEGFWNKIKNLVKPDPKMITVTTADGTILDFGDAVEEESQIVEGSTATVEGTPATGDHVLTDGRTLVFAEGAVTEIKAAEEEEDTVEALQAQIAEKDTRIAELEGAVATAEGENTAMKESITGLKTEFDTFKKDMRTDLGITNPEGRTVPGKEGESRTLYKKSA